MKLKLALILIELLSVLSGMASGAVHHTRCGRDVGSAVSFRQDGNTLYLFTAYHVVESGAPLDIVATKGARVIAGDKKADVALIAATPTKTIKLHPLADSNPKRGDRLLMMGFPDGKLRGEQSYLSYRETNLGNLWATGVGRGGYSGGGIFTGSEPYRLVSVVSGGNAERRSVVGPGLQVLQRFAAKIDSQKQVVFSEKPQPIYVFTDPPNCVFCRDFDRDEKAGAFPGRVFVRVRPGTADYRKLSAEFRQATGRAVPGYPTFWVRGTRKHTVGYSGAATFREWLKNVLLFIPRTILNGASVLVTGQPAFRSERSTGDIRKDVANLRADLAAIKNGNVLEKLPAILRLKGDVAAVKDSTAKLKDDLGAAKRDILVTAETHADSVKRIRTDLKAYQKAEGLEKAIAGAKVLKGVKDEVAAVRADKDRLKDSLDSEREADSTSLLWVVIAGALGMAKRMFEQRVTG